MNDTDFITYCKEKIRNYISMHENEHNQFKEAFRVNLIDYSFVDDSIKKATLKTDLGNGFRYEIVVNSEDQTAVMKILKLVDTTGLEYKI